MSETAIEILRAEAKISMQALMDKALVKDEIYRMNTTKYRYGRYIFMACVSAPVGFLMLSSVMYWGKLHNNYGIGLANIFTRHNTPYRQLYAPEIFKKEMRKRNFEEYQFYGIV